MFYIFPQILIFLYGIPVENKYKILTVKTRKTKKKNIEKHVKEINQIIVDKKKRHHLLKREILKNIKKIKVVIVNYNFHYQQVGDVRVPCIGVVLRETSCTVTCTKCPMRQRDW